ncbi:MAG TPA: hypothetical protein VEU08_23405 [Vicinamibacterales bacterium]|nr:hypothetical protein [Vicinamibacterales bacterium]
MTDIGTLLRAGDPLVHDPAHAAMSPVEEDAMRRAVVAAASQPASSPSWFPPLLALAATAATLSIAIVGANRVDRDHAARSGARSAEAGPHADADADIASGRRQLQFATPGGTRVIWVFDPEFNP